MLSWNKLLRLVTIRQHAVPFSLLMSALLNTPAVYRLTELKSGKKKTPWQKKVNINVSDSYQRIATGLTASIWIVLKPCPQIQLYYKKNKTKKQQLTTLHRSRTMLPTAKISVCSTVPLILMLKSGWAHSEKLYTSHQWVQVLTENHKQIRELKQILIKLNLVWWFLTFLTLNSKAI